MKGYGMFAENVIEQFEDSIDENYPEFDFGFTKIRPSQILKECDPVAYRIALSEFEDSIEQEEDDEEED